MADDRAPTEATRSFWVTLPGLLTAAAAFLTAAAGVIGAWEKLRPERSPRPREPITVAATSYTSGPDVARALDDPQTSWFGDVIMNRPPPDNARANWAEWRIPVASGGRYRLEIEYAAGEARPVQVQLQGQLVNPSALNATTGCWEHRCQRWADVGVVALQAGDSLLRLDRRDGVFPHIRALRFTPVE